MPWGGLESRFSITRNPNNQPSLPPVDHWLIPWVNVKTILHNKSSPLGRLTMWCLKSGVFSQAFLSPRTWSRQEAEGHWRARGVSPHGYEITRKLRNWQWMEWGTKLSDKPTISYITYRGFSSPELEIHLTSTWGAEAQTWLVVQPSREQGMRPMTKASGFKFGGGYYRDNEDVFKGSTLASCQHSCSIW